MYMSNTDKSLLDVTVLVWITLEEKKTPQDPDKFYTAVSLGEGLSLKDFVTFKKR